MQKQTFLIVQTKINLMPTFIMMELLGSLCPKSDMLCGSNWPVPAILILPYRVREGGNCHLGFRFLRKMDKVAYECLGWFVRD